jgi:hypothetical protein
LKVAHFLFSLKEPGMKTLKFSIAATEVPVEIGERRYVLREASADAAVQFKNAMMRSAHYSEDGKRVRLEEADTPKLLLVSLCLYEADADGNLKKGPNGMPEKEPVGWDFAKKLRDEIVRTLFQEAKDISPTLADDTEASLLREKEILERRLSRFRLNGSAEDIAKNSQPATETT